MLYYVSFILFFFCCAAPLERRWPMFISAINKWGKEGMEKNGGNRSRAGRQLCAILCQLKIRKKKLSASMFFFFNFCVYRYSWASNENYIGLMNLLK